MKITHVIRGDDHLNNTPRQINMLRALGATPPVYAHVPMILGPDGAKLSKRHGAVSVLQYREEGYLPEALLNYLVRLGWSHGDQEMFSLEEMVAALRHRGRQQVGRRRSIRTSSLWLNQQHMMRRRRLTARAAAASGSSSGSTSGERIQPARGIVALRSGSARRRSRKWRRPAGSSSADSSAYDEKAARKNLTAGEPSLC